jgi:hypothetical protein
MTPEYKNVDMSTKVDVFTFGLVLETLTGYVVFSPDPGHRNLFSMFDQELDTDITLLHIDNLRQAIYSDLARTISQWT